MADVTQEIAFNLTAHDGVSGPIGKIGQGFENLAQGIGGDLGDLLENVGQGLEDIDKAAPGVASKMTVIGGAAAALGIALLTLGSKEKQATDQLKTAIEDSGNAWVDYQGKVEDAIRAGEDFGFSSEDTQNALASLVESTQNPTLALKAMAAVMDFAAAKHESLAAAAQQVQRALNGNGKVLRQYGIDLHNIKDPTERADAAIAGLEKRFGGQAAASVDNFAAKIHVATVKVEDFFKSVSGPVGQGIAIIGTVIGTVGSVLQVVYARAAIKATVANTDLAASNVAVATTATEAATALTAEAGAIEAVSIAGSKGLPGAGAAGGGKGGGGPTFPGGAGGKSPGGGASKPGDFGKFGEPGKFTSSNLKTTAGQGAATGAEVGVGTIAAGGAALLGGGIAEGVGNKNLDKGNLKRADDFYTSAFKRNAITREEAIQQETDAWKQYGDASQNVADSFPKLTSALNATLDPTLAVNIGFDAMAKAQDRAGQAGDKLANRNAAIVGGTNDLIDRNNQVAVTFEGLKDRVSGYVGETQALYDANQQSVESILAVRDAMDAQYAAMEQTLPTLSAMYQGVESLTQAEHAAEDGRKQTIADIVKLNKAHKATKEQVHATFDEIVAQAHRAADATASASGKDAAYRGELDKMRTKVKKGSPLYVELSNFIALLDAAAKKRTAEIDLVISQKGLAATHHDTSVPNAAHGAIGGRLSANRPVLVGEFGRELFIPDHAGTLIPNNQISQARGANGVGNTYNIYTRSSDPTEIVRAIQSFERGNSTAWRAA